jgi:hypothetical protein
MDDRLEDLEGRMDAKLEELEGQLSAEFSNGMDAVRDLIREINRYS